MFIIVQAEEKVSSDTRMSNMDMTVFFSSF